jgi:biotin synthase
MKQFEIQTILEASETGQPISEELAYCVLRASAGDIPHLLSAASRVRSRYFGDDVRLCSILNARSGACAEDCAFCAQAACHDTGVEPVPLVSEEGAVAAYEDASKLPITHFGVVTSGGALPPEGIERICNAIRSRTIPNLNWCASLGCLDEEQLATLKAAGLKRFHHNLETAESFFPEICTTHSYAQRLNTVHSAKRAGLEVCCGGILGLGESLEQRVEFALLLAREAVDAIPLNFLIPIAGTALAHLEPMKPLDILRAVIMFRLTNPRAEIKVCAGRGQLRDLQSMIFYAGATGMMIGPLLTVAGRDDGQDLQMLRDLEVGVHGL